MIFNILIIVSGIACLAFIWIAPSSYFTKKRKEDQLYNEYLQFRKEFDYLKEGHITERPKIKNQEDLEKEIAKIRSDSVLKVIKERRR